MWRVQSDDDGAFDELVVRLTKSAIIHIECMGGNHYFVDLGGRSFSVGVDKGKVYCRAIDGDGSPGARE